MDGTITNPSTLTVTTAGGGDMTAIPTKCEVIERLSAVILGAETREQVSAWALSFILNDDLEIRDACVWSILKALGGADLMANMDGAYLYSIDDFKAWLADLQRDVR